MMIRTALLVALLGACALPVAQSGLKSELEHTQKLQYNPVRSYPYKDAQPKKSALSALTYAFGLDTTHVMVGNGSEGWYPSNSMIQGSDGNLYGTTESGLYTGTFYKVVTTGNVGSASSTYTVLHTFGDGSVANDGGACMGKLVQDGSGYIYGTCNSGGSYGWGVIYKINPSNGAVTILRSFDCDDDNDGCSPSSGLVRDPNTGNLYGTTLEGDVDGIAANGTIFKLVPSGGSWTYSVLYRFGGGVSGGNPLSIVLGSDGKLYGTALGGVNYTSVVWRYNLSNGTFTRIQDLPSGTEVPLLYGGITQLPTSFASGGRMEFWGVARSGGSNSCGSITCGVVYKLSETSPGSGSYNYTVMHNFNDGTNEGYFPLSDLVFATDIQNYSLDAGGAFYGTTERGGLSGTGTIFRIDTAGTFWDIPKDVGLNGGVPDNVPTGLIKGSISGTPVLWGSSQQSGSSNSYHGWLWHVFGW